MFLGAHISNPEHWNTDKLQAHKIDVVNTTYSRKYELWALFT